MGFSRRSFLIGTLALMMGCVPTSFLSAATLIKEANDIEPLKKLSEELKERSVGLYVLPTPDRKLYFKLGLLKGDVLLSVNNIPIQRYEELKEAYHRNLLDSQTMVLKLLRKNKVQEKKVSFIR